MEISTRKNNGWRVHRTLDCHIHPEFQNNRIPNAEKIGVFQISGCKLDCDINPIKVLRPDLLHPQ